MDLSPFIQLGIGGVAIVVIFLMVKEFMKFIARQQADFTELIKNHLKHDTEAKVKLEKSSDKLATAVLQLLQWLTKKNNQ